MSTGRIRIAPIVEGHGEDQAVCILLQRVWTEVLQGEHAEVLKPIRGKRQKLDRETELSRAINFALLKLQERQSAEQKLVLILLDADNELPCVLGPKLLEISKSCRSDVDLACVVANVEYETWFVACAESLGEYLKLDSATTIPDRPEEIRAGKGWVAQRFAGTKYSETVDQPRMTARMDLELCRRRSPSFEKLCRELQKRLPPPSP